jgi:hypothetical protein
MEIRNRTGVLADRPPHKSAVGDRTNDEQCNMISGKRMVAQMKLPHPSAIADMLCQDAW